MTRYYLSNTEISEQEAKAIEAKNQEYLASGNIEDWAKIQFIFVEKVGQQKWFK